MSALSSCTPEERIRSHYRWLWATMWLLGIELRTSERADSGLSHIFKHICFKVQRGYTQIWYCESYCWIGGSRGFAWHIHRQGSKAGHRWAWESDPFCCSYQTSFGAYRLKTTSELITAAQTGTLVISSYSRCCRQSVPWVWACLHRATSWDSSIKLKN